MLVYFDEMTRLKTVRSGIIPYLLIKGELYFLLGIDKTSGELSDLGGGRKESETPISCSLRELIEETKELIQPKDLKQIKVGVYDRQNSNCILFCELINPELYTSLENDFKTSTKRGAGYEEMSSLVWLKTEQMIFHIYSEHSNMWSRTKHTLGNSCNFDDKLLTVLSS